MDGDKNCSKKQLDPIEKIISENKHDPNELDQLAGEMFGAKVQALNELQASGFIDELLDRYSKGKQNGQRGRYRRGGRVTKGATA